MGTKGFFDINGDYIPSHDEIYADGWTPPVDDSYSGPRVDYEAPPRKPNSKPISDYTREILLQLGSIDSSGKITPIGANHGFTQKYVDGKETLEDIKIENAIQAERFRIAYGGYYKNDKHATQ